jgi:preprotein translocase subunit SecD
MKTMVKMGRLLLPVSLLALAACQTVPGNAPASGSTPSSSTTAPATSEQAPKAAEQAPAERQGAPVAVFLADTQEQPGWRQVKIQAGTLFINPQPVLTREDLQDVQAGTSRQGEGLLALGLTELGKKKVADITAANPNKRLALVVGRTLLAAPGYTAQVTTDKLVFAVGTEANAAAAARAIAGVPSDANSTTPQGAAGMPAQQ